MARPKSVLPTYCHHKPTDTARCWVGGKWVSLGRYNSPESRADLARIVAELSASPAPAAVAAPGRVYPDLSVNELLVAFMRYAGEQYRRPDGTATNEVVEYRHAVRPHRGKRRVIPIGPRPRASRRPRAAGGWPSRWSRT